MERKFYNSIEWGIQKNELNQIRSKGLDYLEKIGCKTNLHYNLTIEEIIKQPEKINEIFSHNRLFIIILEPKNRNINRILEFNIDQKEQIYQFINKINPKDWINFTVSIIEQIQSNENLVKIVPKRCRILFEDGYEILVGMAKTFYPNLKVNLLNSSALKRALSVFDEDMDYSEYENPSVVTNLNAQLGFDFWINYNGNITTWGNQQLDNLNNLYVDDYNKIVSDIYSNIISYSFIDKGYYYRERIVDEINSKAVLRSKAINIRDYAGALILEEQKTALYYAIRVIQDYLKDGILLDSDLEYLSTEVRETINLSQKELAKLYNDSEYNILNQYEENEQCDIEEWIDIFTLIRLGHYDVTMEQISKALKVFNQRFNQAVTNIDDLIDSNASEQNSRLIERITFMKNEAIEICI